MVTRSTVRDIDASAANPLAPATGGGVASQRAAYREAVRVMHVLFALQPGGMEFGVLKLVNGLPASRIRSTICSTRPVQDAVRALVSPEVALFEMQRRDGNDPGLVWQLYKLFRRERPHIVHTHAWGTLFEGLLAARLARVPAVIHGEHGTLQLKAHQRWLQRTGWGSADQTLSVSSRLAERMAASSGFPLSRIRVIRNGVDFSRFSSVRRDASRASLGLPTDALVIGTAGRLVPVKHHANLLDALAVLAGSGVEFTAVLAGEGPLRRELETYAADRGLSKRVRFLGHRPDVETVYAALDVFVLSSRSEGLSNTILEAMASGAPVVATRVGGADELVDDGRTGVLVPPEDPQALATALLQVVRHPLLLREMGAAGKMKAETEFGLPRMLRDYEALYLEVAPERRYLFTGEGM